MTGPEWDVFVVGPGPPGATTAALLAQAGHRILVLEKDAFPRFHIGESLLPAGLPVLDRLGVEPHEDTFVYKRGAAFVCETSGRAQGFRFDEALPGCPSHAWHVERSRFDTVLRDRAVAAAAEVRHGVTVTRTAVEGDRVRVHTGGEALTGRFLVDASGQNRLLATQAGSVEPYHHFGAAAVFTHYRGLGDAAIEELGPDNDIRIMMRPEGWGWVIPLPDRRLSVGVVTKGPTTPDQLDQGLLAGPLVQRLTAGAERMRTRVLRNFSYRNTVASGRRFACIGDAACFLDPVFSSGVTLALRGGEDLADRLGPALAAGEEAETGFLAAHHTAMERAYRTFASMIDRFYNTRFAETVFLAETADRSMRPGIMSILAGDVWRTGNPFQELLLKGRRRNGLAGA